jgi:hypothetical protein
MTSSGSNPGKRVKDVRFSEDTLTVDLVDGRTITVPLEWYPRLLHASPERRANWTIAGGGFGMHWSDIHEDLSTGGLLRGSRAPGGPTSSAV